MISGDGWLAVDGVDPRRATFPAAARFKQLPVWIFRSDGAFFGVAYSCPHAHQTMDTGQLVENGTAIRCSYHHYVFTLSNGAGVNCPSYSIAVYDVQEDSGTLWIRPRRPHDASPVTR